MPDNLTPVDALLLLGQAWRGDWSDFDGRTLRDQLNSWGTECNTGKITPIEWLWSCGVCHIHKQWYDTGTYGSCDSTCAEAVDA